MDYQSKEIDLIDYIKVISKRKQLIFALFLVGLVVGLGSYFLMPKTYKAEVILEIGSFSERSGEIIVYKLIEEPSQVAEKIKSGFYGDYPGIKVTVPQSTKLIKIEIVRKTPEEAEEILKSIKEEVLDEYNKELEFRRSIIEEEKTGYDELVNMYNNLIKNLEKDIFNLKKNISSLILQNQQIAVLHAKIYDLQIEIYDLQFKVYNFRLRIKNIQKEIETFQPTRMIKKPTVSEKEPNLLLNLSAGGILGIFLGVILAFLKEWWDKNKYKIRQ